MWDLCTKLYCVVYLKEKPFIRVRNAYIYSRLYDVEISLLFDRNCSKNTKHVEIY